MPKRWSKLQTKLYNLIEPSTDFQIHVALYEMNGNGIGHGYKLPRYFITIGKDIIFDYPKDFDTTGKHGFNSYPWDKEASDISNMIEEYIERPMADIMKPFENDKWGLTDILRACDRRIGKRRLKEMLESTEDERIKTIVAKRLG